MPSRIRLSRLRVIEEIEMVGNRIWRAIWMIVAFAIVPAGVLLSGPEQTCFAWEMGTPIVSHWGLNTAYPGSTASQTLQYDVDGGYNLIWASQDETFHVAKQKGLRALVVDPAYWQYQASDLSNPTKKAYIDSDTTRLNSTTTVNGQQVPNFPAFYGYYLGDEYPASNFAAMGELVNYLRTADPQHATYANISGLPGQITSQQQVNDYHTYLNQFLTTVRPSLFSYDYYQLTNHFSGTTYVGPSDLNGYLMNLGIVSSAAKQAGIPFMNIVQASRWNAGVRTPNANELRFLVYSTLAYGAQGISYYDWWRRYDAPLPGQPYYNGDTTVGAIQPLSWNPLTPTAVYTALTPLNHEFVKIAEQLQGQDQIGTYLKGYINSVPLGTLDHRAPRRFPPTRPSASVAYPTACNIRTMIP